MVAVTGRATVDGAQITRVNTLVVNDAPPSGRFPKANWITKEGVITQTQANTARANIQSARGGSTRQTWLATDADPTVWATMLTRMRNAGCNRMAVRLIPGRKMPVSKMGRTLAGDDGTTFPAPCNVDNTPNSVFIANLKIEMRKAAQACIAQADLCSPVDQFPIVHWPWFAKEWSEWYYGPEVQRDCTRDQMEEAHKAIVDAAWELHQEFNGRFITGFQLSGHGPIQTSVEEITRYIETVFPPEQAMIHANGLSSGGQWGAQPPGGPADQAMDVAFVIAAEDVPSLPGYDNLLVGLQAIQPWGTSGNAQLTPAQWDGVFDQIRLAGGDSLEIYLESFLSDAGVTGSLAAFQSQSAAWLAEPRA